MLIPGYIHTVILHLPSSESSSCHGAFFQLPAFFQATNEIIDFQKLVPKKKMIIIHGDTLNSKLKKKKMH